jgi:hypothetical protein
MRQEDGLHVSCSGPATTTVPAKSMPRIIGRPGASRKNGLGSGSLSPRRIFHSIGLTLVAFTLTSNSSDRSAGVGTSRNDKLCASPKSLSTAARRLDGGAD